MATIVIPMGPGGQGVSVEVPNFAMESTQEDMLRTLQQIAGGQNAIQASNKGVSQGDQQITRNLKDLSSKIDADRAQRIREHAANTKQFAKSVGGAVTDMAGKNAMGISSMFNALGLGMIATQFAMVTSQAEVLAKALAYGGRIGLNYGHDLLETNKALSEVGLTLSDFASIVGTNLAAMRELGGSVEEGSKVFLRQVEAFRSGSEEFGYFGMLSGEMAQFMSEEMEIRRKMLDADEYRLYVETQLTDSMIENMRQQERMARITGEDVRDRIAAQMEMRRGTIAETFLRGATTEQADRLGKVGANLGRLEAVGPLGKEISKAIQAGVVQQGGAELVAGELMAKSPAIANLIRESIAAINNGGMTDQQINARMTELIEGIRTGEGGMADSSLISLALVGDKVSAGILDFRNGLTEISDSNKELIDAQNRQATAAEQLSDEMRKIGADTERFQRTAEVIVQQFIKGIAGGETSDILQSYESFMSTFQQTLASDDVRNFVEGFGVAFGEAGLKPLQRVIEGSSSFIDDAIILGNVLSALGATTIGGALSTPGYVMAALKGLKNISDSGSLPSMDLSSVIDGNSLSVIIKDISDLAEKKIGNTTDQVNEIINPNPNNNEIPADR